MRMKTNKLQKGFPGKRAAMRGVAAVEYAILLLPMMLLAFGVVEYGRALYQYNTLVKNVRDGVRILAQNNPTDEAYADIQTDARCLVIYGNTACTGAPLVPGLTTGHVQICDRIHFANCTGAVQGDYLNVETGLGVINLVEVRITGYQFEFLGLPFVTSSASLNFTDIRAVMRQIV